MEEETLDSAQESTKFESVRRTLRLMLGGLDPSIANASEDQIRDIGLAFGLSEIESETLVSHNIHVLKPIFTYENFDYLRNHVFCTKTSKFWTSVQIECESPSETEKRISATKLKTSNVVN